MSDKPHMDPSGRRRINTTAIAVLAAAALVLSITGALYARLALSAGPAPKVPLTVSSVRFEPGESYERQAAFLGLVSSGEKAQLSFEISGRIAEFPARQGSEVKAGDILALLDDQALQATRRALAADLDHAEAEVELARVKLTRQEKLIASGSVSRERFDETRLTERALVSRAEATRARLDAVDIELSKARLVAPYDGIIAERFTYPGAVVSPGVPVVRLLQTGVQEAHIGVAAASAGTLEVGAHYPLQFRGETVEAQLVSVRADVDPVTRAATTVFALPADIAALDGEPVTLYLRETVIESGGWLPVSALLEGRNGLWTVLRIEQDGANFATVTEAVEIVDVQGDRAYVRGTLPADALVVSDGIHRITPGNPVLLAGDP